MAHTTESIYKLFCCRLKPFILKWIPDTHQADDIQQEVFIKIHEKVGSLKDKTKMRSWVLQITKNTILDFLRKQKFQSEELSKIENELAEYDQIIETNERNLKLEMKEGLKEIIEILPEKYAEAIRLVEFEGLSQIELAKKLNISTSGAKSRIQRARKLIKDSLMNCCHYEFDKYGTVIGVR